MGLVKLLTGKTFKRIVSGQPGDLDEFFAMTRELRDCNGKIPVSVRYQINSEFFGNPSDSLDTVWNASTLYSSGLLSFDHPLSHTYSVRRDRRASQPFFAERGQKEIGMLLEVQHHAVTQIYPGFVYERTRR